MIEFTETPQELLIQNGDFEVPAECTEIFVTEEEKKMCPEAINFLLDEILKRKKELHNSRHRRNKFFPEIRERLIIDHGLSYNTKTLEKKFCNLKKHLDTLISRDINGTFKKPVSWPYFGKMMEIFSEELAIEDAPTMASLYPPLPLPKTALQLHPNRKQEKTLPTDSSSEEDDIDLENEGKTKPKESNWNNKAVVFFLKECFKKKEDLWDPLTRRRDVFDDIRSRMKTKGFTFYPETLDRKLRNMKVRYQVIIKAIQENGTSRRYRVRWPYFQLLHEIYEGYDDRDVVRKRNRPKPTSTNADDELELLRKNASEKLQQLRKEAGVKSPIDEDEIYEKCDDQDVDRMIGRHKPMSTNDYDELDLLRKTSNEKLQQLRKEAGVKSPTYEDEEEPTTSKKFRPIRPKPPSEPNKSSFEKTNPLTENNKPSNRRPTSPGDMDVVMLDNEPTMDDPIEVKSYELSQQFPEDITDDLEFAQRILALEQRRTVATEKLLHELTESNRIREQRIKFKRIQLAHIKSRSKWKSQS